MRLSHWAALIGVVVGLGCLQVAQRNAVVLKGYAVGERMARVHHDETDALWLNAQVVELASPTHLSQVARERRLKFVAWSTLSPAPSFTRTGQDSMAHPTTSEPIQRLARDDTSD